MNGPFPLLHAAYNRGMRESKFANGVRDRLGFRAVYGKKKPSGCLGVECYVDVRLRTGGIVVDPVLVGNAVIVRAFRQESHRRKFDNSGKQR